MSDAEKNSPATVILGIAWLQFLTMAAVIDKADMRNVSAAWMQGIDSPFIWTWDWTKFGGVSIALIVMAVCFLTLPALLDVMGGKVARPAYVRPFLETLVKIGFFAWLFSFLSFIGYLNRLSVIILYASLAVILAIAFFFKMTYKDKA